MRDRDSSQDKLLAELKYLRSEVAYLRTIKVAFDAQNELVRSISSMGQAATGHLMLRALVLQAAHIASKIAQAEECSLLMLGANGAIEESILARGATIRENKKYIMNEVLAEGLAGWVARTRQVALIPDATKDDRWLTLPDQPYTARSVLCLPIIRGRAVIGILTLTHSEANKFSQHMARIVQTCTAQMALVLDNARLYMKSDRESQPPPQTLPSDRHDSYALSQLGFYIIDNRGKFLYSNPRLAEIFGYSQTQFITLESILVLISTEDRKVMTEKFTQCFSAPTPQAHLSCQFQGQQKGGATIDVEINASRARFYGKFTLIGALRAL